MSFMDDASFVVPVTPISQYLNPQGFVLASRYSQYNIDSFHIQYHPGNSITSSGMAGGVLTQPVELSYALQDTGQSPIYNVALGQNHNLRQCSLPWTLKADQRFLKRYNAFITDSQTVDTAAPATLTLSTDMSSSTVGFGGFFDVLKGLATTVLKVGYNLLTPEPINNLTQSAYFSYVNGVGTSQNIQDTLIWNANINALNVSTTDTRYLIHYHIAGSSGRYPNLRINGMVYKPILRVVPGKFML